MFTFRLANHGYKPGIQLCEILENDKVVGAIYSTEEGIKIVSRRLFENPEGAVTINRSKFPPIPSVDINLVR